MKAHLRAIDGMIGRALCGKNEFNDRTGHGIHSYDESYFIDELKYRPDNICSRCLKKYHDRQNRKANKDRC